MLRAACPTPLTITSDHVPGYLDQQRYERWFATFDPSEQRNIRRAVPIAITQLIDDCDLSTAADRLGIPGVSAQAALIRAGRACKRTDRDDEFRRLIGQTALDLQATPVNYGHRRRYFTADWTMPDEDWHAFQQSLLDARLARRDTPWNVRRPAYAAWVWSLVTGGDSAVAPMVQTQSDGGRTCTGGVMEVLSTLTRRCTTDHIAIVADYAARLTALVDSSNDPANLPDAQSTTSRPASAA
jgi:hypothetical protein